MMEKEKIEVVQFCEKWGSGGLEAFVMNVYRNINNDEIKFKILLSQNKGNGYDKEIEMLGGSKKVLLSNKTKSPMIRVIRNYIKFYKEIKRNNYKIIHFNACNASVMICVFIAKIAGVPIRIVHSHNTDIGKKHKLIKTIYHKICKNIFGKTGTLYYACSVNAANWLFTPKIVKNKVEIIKNGIDVTKFIFNEDNRKKVRSELGIENKFVLGHVGRFGVQKNHSFLIDIFYEVYKKNKESVLLLIGVGELEEEIKNKVKLLGIESQVFFLGLKSNIPQYLHAMDAFVFPSLFEGLGIVAIEAQAAALKIFASDVVPQEANITEYFNYISLEKSATEWAEKILKCKEGYIRRDCSQEIKENGYDIKKVAKEMENIYINEYNKINK
ncbi:MAG: glycosyltransferase family 1 protein [Clostridium sp.]